MRLTILTETSTVGKDTLFFDGLDLSPCGIPENVSALQWLADTGHIELKTTEPNQPISQLPAWAIACISVWQDAYDVYTAPPTDEQKKFANAEAAKQLLKDSDWAVLPDVQLKNRSEWENYRSVVRAIAINPTPDVVFPAPPEEIW